MDSSLESLVTTTDEASNLQKSRPNLLAIACERMFWLTKVHPPYSSTIVTEAFIVPASERTVLLYSLVGVSINMSKCSRAHKITMQSLSLFVSR